MDIPLNNDEFMDQETLDCFLATGLENTCSWLIYFYYANFDEIIEGDIDLSVICEKLGVSKLTKKRVVKGFNQLCQFGLVEQLHSRNWKHRTVRIYPLKQSEN